MRHRALHALESLSQHLSDIARFAEAVEAATLAVCADPLRDSAQRALIEAHVAEGNVIEGRRACDAYIATIQRELEIEPPPYLLALRSKIGYRPTAPSPSVAAAQGSRIRADR